MKLVAGTLASYLLGDSVTRFSAIIGTDPVCAWALAHTCRAISTPTCWLGSSASRSLVGMVGGFRRRYLFVLFEADILFSGVLLYALVVVTGTLIGLWG